MEHPTTASRPRRPEREGILALGQCNSLFRSLFYPRGGVSCRPARQWPWRAPCAAAAVAAGAA
eukprot:373524-Pyramimonas_sp.AAC.2